VDATQIGEAQPLVSPLRAGMTDTVAVAWTVPITATGRDIWVLVDPYAEVLESDETNNLAHVRAVFPDLLVSSMYADYAAPDTIQISTTLSNRGVAPATDVGSWPGAGMRSPAHCWQKPQWAASRPVAARRSA